MIDLLSPSSAKILLAVVLVLAVIAIASNRVKPAVVLFAAALFCALVGYISVEQWLNYAGNSNLIVILLLMIITPSIISLRDLIIIRQKLLSLNANLANILIGFIIYPLSAIISNTAVTSFFLNVFSKSKTASHNFLLPVSYFSIIAGTATLIGTSTHLIASAWLYEQTGIGLSFFVFTPLSLVLFVVCMPIIVITTKFFLTNIKQPNIEQEENYWVMEVRVKPDSPWVGLSVEGADLRKLETLYLSQVVRNGQLILNISPNFLIQANDRLQFIGSLEQFSALHSIRVLEGIQADVKKIESKIVQVVVPKHSSLVNKKLIHFDFRSKMDAVVLGIKRGRVQYQNRIARVNIEPGDVLALIAGSKFRENYANNPNVFQIIDGDQQFETTGLRNRIFGIAAFLFSIGLVAYDVFSLATVFICLTLFFLWLRILEFADIKQRFSIDLYISLISSLAIAQAVISSGLAVTVAQFLHQLLVAMNSQYIVELGLVCILLYGTLLTNLITNVATVTLTLPFAISLAQINAIDPTAYIMAAIFSASCAFLTPFAYQTHLMVMTPGSYKLQHFLQMGIPLTIVYIILCQVFIPIFFPFQPV